MRSRWKPNLPFFLDQYRSSISSPQTSDTYGQPVCSRRSRFPQSIVGSRIFVYNGCRFLSARVRPVMVNRYVGEFFFTKKIGFSIHIPKKKKRKKKSN